MSSGAADVLRRVVTPMDDGWWDLTSIYFEPNLEDLRSPYLCNGDKREAISTDELYKAVSYLPRFMSPEHCNNVGWIALMKEHAQVFWKGSGICLFERVDKRHLEVLRIVQESMSYPQEREDIGVSFTETILSLSELYGCRGDHKRTCPAPGDRARSLITASGEIKMALLKKLRDVGLASDA